MVRLLGAVVAFVALLTLPECARSDGKPTGQADKALPRQGPGDPGITYDEVLKAPTKFRGKRVTWRGWMPGITGKDLLVVLRPDPMSPRKERMFVVRCASAEEADKVFDGTAGRFTATVAGKITITYPVEDPIQGDLVEITQTVPLLVHPKFELGKNGR